MFGVDPRDTVEVGLHEVVLDASVQVETEVLGGGAVGQRLHVLAGNSVQPAQAFVAGNRDDEAVGPVDDGNGGDGGTLFAQWIPVVPRQALIGTSGR